MNDEPKLTPEQEQQVKAFATQLTEQPNVPLDLTAEQLGRIREAATRAVITLIRAEKFGKLTAKIASSALLSVSAVALAVWIWNQLTGK